MGDPLALNHRRTLLGTLPADGPDPDFVQPMSDYGDTHVLGGAAADGKVPKSKASATDKAEWDWLLPADTTVAFVNSTGGGLVQGDVVAVSATPGQVSLDDTVGSLRLFAVCAELTLANTVSGRFWMASVMPVVKNKGAVTAGHYVRKSATTKAVETTGVAAASATPPPTGSLGLALTTAAGDGTIAVLWFLRGVSILPPVTEGYLVGTGTGYAVQAVPLPIAHISTGTPTGAKFLRDDGVLAVPPGTGGGGISVVNRATSPITVSNTTTETALFSFAVPAGSLATDKRLRLRLLCTVTDTNAAVASRTLTLRAKYGATTVATLVLATALSDGGCPPAAVTIGATQPLGIAFELAALGVTNAQQGLLVVDAPSLLAFASEILTRVPLPTLGTAAEDSAADKTLTLTAQWSAANAGNSMTMKYAALELV